MNRILQERSMGPGIASSTLAKDFGTRSLVSIRWIVSALTSFLAPGPGFAAEVRTIANILKPLSAPAEAVYEASLLALLVCAAIFTVVVGLLTYVVIRFRARSGDDDTEPPQVYGSNQLEMAWTVIPILIVFVLVLVTARTIA